MRLLWYMIVLALFIPCYIWPHLSVWYSIRHYNDRVGVLSATRSEIGAEITNHQYHLFSTFTFCSGLEEIFPNKSTFDGAIEMKCVRSEPDNVSGQWLHSAWLIMLCSTQNVTQRYTVLQVRQCLFWLLRAVLRSLLPRQMLIANEHIQVLRIVGQGESIVSNFQTIVTLITLGVIPRMMMSIFMCVVPFDGQKVLQKLPRLHPRGG